MTVTQHGGPGAPYPPVGVPTLGPPASSPPPGGQPGYDWRYATPAPRRGRLLAVGVVAAIVLAAAALVIGIVLLVRPAPAPAPPAASSTPSESATTGGDTTQADRALCTAIAPLMSENDQFSNAYVGLGAPGTPARDAATPKFITDTQDWIRRIQPIVDANPNVDPYLHRSLQRLVDDRHLLVVDLTPGPLTAYATTLWQDSIGAYSGPLHLCDGLGVKW